jgi:hypothetical protein
MFINIRMVRGCNELRELDFDPNQRIKVALSKAYNFYPASLENLKSEHERFIRY